PRKTRSYFRTIEKTVSLRYLGFPGGGKDLQDWAKALGEPLEPLETRLDGAVHSAGQWRREAERERHAGAVPQRRGVEREQRMRPLHGEARRRLEPGHRELAIRPLAQHAHRRFAARNLHGPLALGDPAAARIADLRREIAAHARLRACEPDE